MTESERRDLEKLKSTEDYINEIRIVSDVVCGSKKADKEIDDTLLMLVQALKEKYKYIIANSKAYRKKQSVFAKISDIFAQRKRKKFEKQIEKETAMHEKATEPAKLSMDGQVPSCPALASTQSKIEVLDKVPVGELLNSPTEEDPEEP